LITQLAYPIIWVWGGSGEC